MQSFGHINFNSNQAQQMSLQLETDFPDTPVVGRIIFKDKRVFICVEIASGVPAWLPLTNELDTYTQRTAIANASETWVVSHNLNTLYPLVQIYDTNYNMVIPANVSPIDNNNTRVSFGWPMAGTAVAMFGDSTGTEKMQGTFTYTQSSPSGVWVIQHDLGYYPVVRVFTGNQEILPSSIVHTSLNIVTLTFDTAIAGIARLV